MVFYVPFCSFSNWFLSFFAIFSAFMPMLSPFVPFCLLLVMGDKKVRETPRQILENFRKTVHLRLLQVYRTIFWWNRCKQFKRLLQLNLRIFRCNLRIFRINSTRNFMAFFLISGIKKIPLVHFDFDFYDIWYEFTPSWCTNFHFFISSMEVHIWRIFWSLQKYKKTRFFDMLTKLYVWKLVKLVSNKRKNTDGIMNLLCISKNKILHKNSGAATEFNINGFI